MTNAMLRKQAWHAYWRNRGQLWLLFLLTTALNTAWYYVQQYLLAGVALGSLIGLLYSLSVLPVTYFGLTHVLLMLLQGKKTRLPMLFDTFKAPFHPLKLYAAAAVTLFPFLLVTVVSLAGIPAINSTFGLVSYFAVSMSVIFLLVWFMLRMYLFPYLVVLQPE